MKLPIFLSWYAACGLVYSLVAYHYRMFEHTYEESRKSEGKERNFADVIDSSPLGFDFVRNFSYVLFGVFWLWLIVPKSWPFVWKKERLISVLLIGLITSIYYFMTDVYR